MKIAAIDIGSNAARLLIVEANTDNKGHPFYRKINLIRVPLRLGFDVFETGIISEKKEKMIVQMMVAFKHMLMVYEIEHIRACATSSLRDAKNGKKVLKRIKRKSDIKVDIISGAEEANIIFDASKSDIIENNDGFLFIDVGGGSTEITFFEEGQIKYSKSFNIGTIRLLKNQVSVSQWEGVQKELKTHIKSSEPIYAVGSGGNINKVFSMSKTKEKKPLKLDILKSMYKDLVSVTLMERIEKFELREDRADVIVPALEIFINIMKWTNINKIIVPKVGLADGLVHQMYQNHTI